MDPYGPESPDFIVGDRFAHQWCSALAFCHKRFEGKSTLFRKEPSGGIGAFTPDSFPVFDRFHGNGYIIADSNHGYKMIGVGQAGRRGARGRMLPPPGAVPLLPLRRGQAASGFQQPVSLELTTDRVDAGRKSRDSVRERRRSMHRC